ncbi:MAG: lytic murein transglycosylase [Alphaproteobacteria bacterium]|nr:lytic murein transglycosylase [Alphaproteobacteria bacterium]
MTNSRLIASICLGLALCVSPTVQAEEFSAWLQAFRAVAQQQGLQPNTLKSLDGITPDEKVLTLDGKQPEHKITFATYRTNILAKARIKAGKVRYADFAQTLKQAEARYGVPGKYIVALWGIESSYGALTGGFSVVRSLATLAYDGRRATFFRGELLAALKIVQRGDVKADALIGSWAGAMGQCQFMPSTYLNHAVDGNGDKRVDIWGNPQDVIASMANYLRAEGWQPKLGWGIAVRLKKPLPTSMVGLTAEQGKTYATWQKLGIKTRSGAVLAPPPARLYYLVQPDGARGPSFLVTENYKALMRWNRSTYFATAVGLLADSIAP